MLMCFQAALDSGACIAGGAKKSSMAESAAQPGGVRWIEVHWPGICLHNRAGRMLPVAKRHDDQHMRVGLTAHRCFAQHRDSATASTFDELCTARGAGSGCMPWCLYVKTGAALTWHGEGFDGWRTAVQRCGLGLASVCVELVGGGLGVSCEERARPVRSHVCLRMPWAVAPVV